MHLLANAPFVVKFKISIELYLTDDERKYMKSKILFLKMKVLFVMGMLGVFENMLIENVL